MKRGKSIEPTLSLCMIVKNEEKNLPRCLKSFQGLVDEIIIVDTGSQDRTKEIAAEFGAKIFDFAWIDDFSAARNFSLEKAMGDWIFWTDADDALMGIGKAKIREYIKDENIEAYILNIVCHAGTVEGFDTTSVTQPRLFRNRPQYRFFGRLHEQIMQRINEYTKGGKIGRISDLEIHHYGYLETVSDMAKKRERNIGILQKELEEKPEDKFVIFNLATEYMSYGEFAKALALFYRSMDGLQPDYNYYPYMAVRAALCHAELGEEAKGLDLLKQCEKYHPYFLDYYFHMGKFYQRMGQYTNAIRVAEKCLEMAKNPHAFSFVNGMNGFRIYHLLGDVYRDMKNYDKAIHYYNEALRDNVKYLNPLCEIAALLIEKDGREKACRQVESYFDLNLPITWVTLGDVFFTAKQPSIALDYLEKALQKVPGDERARFLMGSCFIYKRNFAKALEIFSTFHPASGYYRQCLDWKVFCCWAESDWQASGTLVAEIAKTCAVRARVFSLCELVIKEQGFLGDDDMEFMVREGKNVCWLILRALLDMGEDEMFNMLIRTFQIPEDARDAYQLITLCYEKGYAKKAEEVIRRVILEDKANRKVLQLAVQIYRTKGNLLKTFREIS